MGKVHEISMILSPIPVGGAPLRNGKSERVPLELLKVAALAPTDPFDIPALRIFTRIGVEVSFDRFDLPMVFKRNRSVIDGAQLLACSRPILLGYLNPSLFLRRQARQAGAKDATSNNRDHE